MTDYVIRRKFTDSEKSDIILKCDCNSEEHTVFITAARWEKDEKLTFYINTSLVSRGFFRRLWRGLKYIFGYKCKYGEYEETVIYYDEMVKFRDALNEILEKEK